MSAQDLWKAAGGGCRRKVIKILDAHPDYVDTESGRHRESALMNATGFGQEEVVEVLLERGAEVDKQDKLGRTALHRAASRGHERIVTRLLEAGADAGAMSEIGWTALMTAASCGHVSIVRMLLRERAGLVDHRDRDGASALWVACKNGKADVVKVLLLEGGATHDLPDTYFGWTPCQIVKRMGRRSCLKVLQWFRDEVSRAYVLHKAAMVHETLATQRGPSPFTPPAYLTQRVQDKLALPEVELTSLGPEEEGTGKRAASGKRRRKAGEAEVDEEERVATVAFVVQELNRQLYVELLMGLQLRGPTLIEEEEEDPDTEDEEENAEKKGQRRSREASRLPMRAARKATLRRRHIPSVLPPRTRARTASQAMRRRNSVVMMS